MRLFIAIFDVITSFMVLKIIGKYIIYLHTQVLHLTVRLGNFDHNCQFSLIIHFYYRNYILEYCNSVGIDTWQVCIICRRNTRAYKSTKPFSFFLRRFVFLAILLCIFIGISCFLSFFFLQERVRNTQIVIMKPHLQLMVERQMIKDIFYINQL